MTKVVIAGGTGALGRRISDDLADRGYDVVVLTRSPKPGRHRQVQWDGVTVGDWARELDGAAVINLAGELVDRRPTPANIALLTNSRVDPTRALVEASKLLAHPVPVWIQASTLAIYGDAGETRLDEASPLADGPPQMTDVAKDWGGSGRGCKRVTSGDPANQCRFGEGHTGARATAVARASRTGRTRCVRSTMDKLDSHRRLAVDRSLGPRTRFGCLGGGHRDCPGSRSQFRTDGRAAQAPSPATCAADARCHGQNRRVPSSQRRCPGPDGSSCRIESVGGQRLPLHVSAVRFSVGRSARQLTRGQAAVTASPIVPVLPRRRRLPFMVIQPRIP